MSKCKATSKNTDNAANQSKQTDTAPVRILDLRVREPRKMRHTVEIELRNGAGIIAVYGVESQTKAEAIEKVKSDLIFTATFESSVNRLADLLTKN